MTVVDASISSVKLSAALMWEPKQTDVAKSLGLALKKCQLGGQALKKCQSGLSQIVGHA